METLLPFLIAGVAAIAILLIFVGLAGGSPVDPVQARLTQLGTMQAKNLEELELQQPFLERTLRPLAAAVLGRDVAGREHLVHRRRPRSASRSPATPATCASPTGWASRRSARSSAASCSSCCSCIIGVMGLPPFLRLAMIPIGLAVRLHDPRVLARRPRPQAPEGHPAADPGRPRPADDLRPRRPRLRRGAGQGRREAQGPLTEEFRRALAEIRVGKARRDALRDIVPRTEVPALTNFIGAIIQAEQLGVSISKVLQVQSEQLRIERRQRAEEMAAKAPIKMLFPLVGCIFPSLFIVILGPAIILIMINLKTVASG